MTEKSRRSLIANRFQPGQSGNPGGKTKEQNRLERENAMRATRIRHAFLMTLEAVIDEEIKEDPDDPSRVVIAKPKNILKQMNSDTLKILKDSEERGLGKPVQPVEIAPPTTDEKITARIAILLRKTGLDDAAVAAITGVTLAVDSIPDDDA